MAEEERCTQRENEEGKGLGERRIIKLNVGGRVFHTTQDTLLHRGRNFFAGLLQQSLPSTMDEHGAFFIDRNGDLFAPLLDYLRTGRLRVAPGVSRLAIMEEASFYAIELPETERWTEDQLEYCILEISAKYLSHGKIYFRLYHETSAKPEVVGDISTAGYWEVTKKHLLARIVGVMGRAGWKLSQVLGTEHDDGSVPESYMFSKPFQGRGAPDFALLLDLLKNAIPQ